MSSHCKTMQPSDNVAAKRSPNVITLPTLEMFKAI